MADDETTAPDPAAEAAAAAAGEGQIDLTQIRVESLIDRKSVV